MFFQTKIIPNEKSNNNTADSSGEDESDDEEEQKEAHDEVSRLEILFAKSRFILLRDDPKWFKIESVSRQPRSCFSSLKIDKNSQTNKQLWRNIKLVQDVCNCPNYFNHLLYTISNVCFIRRRFNIISPVKRPFINSKMNKTKKKPKQKKYYAISKKMPHMISHIVSKRFYFLSWNSMPIKVAFMR